MELEASLWDQQSLLSEAGLHSQRPSEMRGTELPTVVYVKLDTCDLEFMPPRICQQI